MAGKNTAVFGIFKSRNQAEQTVDRLLASGFTNNDISVLLADQQSSKEFAHEKNTKAPEGATTGATTGGAIGGTLGLLAGIGALAIPGVGPFIAAGPIMGALAGVGAGAAVGGLIGALVGLGIPEYEAKRYEGHIKDGGILLSVHCDTAEDIKRAKELLKTSGADDIASSGEKSVSTHGVDNSEEPGQPSIRSGCSHTDACYFACNKPKLSLNFFASNPPRSNCPAASRINSAPALSDNGAPLRSSVSSPASRATANSNAHPLLYCQFKLNQTDLIRVRNNPSHKLKY